MISRGVFEFRTKPSEFRDMGGKIRLLAEKDAMHTLSIGTEETMVASNAGYDRELYRISCRVFGPIGSSVWQKDYHLKRPIVEKDITLYHMKDMYDEVDIEGYTPVKWSDGSGYFCYDDYQEYARRIFLMSGRKDVPAWTFVMKDEKNSIVLYVRTAFLETFRTGQNILNYVRMAMAARVDRERKRKYHIKRTKYYG